MFYYKITNKRNPKLTKLVGIAGWTYEDLTKFSAAYTCNPYYTLERIDISL